MQMIERLAGDLSENNKIIAVFLFGSYLNGNYKEFSDIDICIIGNLSEKEKKEILRNLPEKFDISFFDELPVWIKMRALKGKCLLLKDKEKLHSIAMNTIHEYNDFLPLIKRGIERRFGICT